MSGGTSMERPNRAVIVATMIGGFFVSVRGFAGEGVTGQWTYSKVLQSGELAVWTLELKQVGERLTGVYRFSGGAVVPIEEGKVERGRISFKTRHGLAQAACTGTLKDDLLELETQAEIKGKKRPAVKQVFKRSRASDKQAGERSDGTSR